MRAAAALSFIRLIHTVVWAFFVLCIVAIPLLGYAGQFTAAWVVIGLVVIEVVMLVVNRLRCPLTDVAARYTDDRRPNFDIYLPVWIAKYNKEIFGPLFLGGTLFTIGRWAGWLG